MKGLSDEDKENSGIEADALSDGGDSVLSANGQTKVVMNAQNGACETRSLRKDNDKEVGALYVFFSQLLHTWNGSRLRNSSSFGLSSSLLSGIDDETVQVALSIFPMHLYEFICIDETKKVPKYSC